MKKMKQMQSWLTAIALIAVIGAWTGIGKAQSNGPGSSAPTVTTTLPTDEDAVVTLNQAVAVTFSHSMNSESMNGNLILTGPDGSPIEGEVHTRGRTSVFRPSTDLMPDTTYTVRVEPEASDLADNALGHELVWNFTTGATSDTTKPTVTATNPANAALNVPVNRRIVAIFSEAMSPGSLGTASFKVTKPGGAAVAGSVTYASGSASFKPVSGFSANTHYVATITTGAKDLAGNPLAGNYVWSFNTGANSDLVRPSVTSTNPTAGALHVPISQKINATFSEGMDYATITTGNFFLTWSGGRVVGTIAYFYDVTNKVTIVSLVPKANLLANTLYTATITSQARDLAGNVLAGNKTSGNYVWQFMTGTTTGQSAVPLGAAVNFAILAATTVTNTSTPTTVTGDLGLWPGTSVTGFPPGIVNGNLDVNDPAAQAGEAALTVAYNDAKGRVGAFTPAIGNVGGLTFTPGLYRSATSTAISGGGDLTLDAQGDPNAVFIFQIGTTLTTSSGFGITLKGGAKSSQIFWQVGSSATIGTGTHFAGSILAHTSITLVSGAVLNGRALAGAAVTMDNNTVVRPAP